jgi:extracellular elastinolytic metalloproteinase
MRRLFVASVLAAGLAGSLAHSKLEPVRTSDMEVRRKTMGFGPDHPHSVFKTDIPQAFQPLHLFANGDPPHPFEVAKEFVKTLVPQTFSLEGGEQMEGASSFYVRPDSYIDNNTGIAHVYLRQTVYGVEVADGDVNVNIDVEDGRILSYGSSVNTPLHFLV